jgi:3-deoxy-D-manno-octulosonic acid (KDO) 8-phosphate synthase
MTEEEKCCKEHETEEAEIKELKEVLKTVREEVPGLLKDIVGPLKELMTTTMTEEQAKEKAKAIAAFYKELVAAGIKEEDAIDLVKSQFLSPSDIFKLLASQTREVKNS